MDRHLDMTMAGPWDVPMVVSRASTTVVLTAKTTAITMAEPWDIPMDDTSVGSKDLSWAYSMADSMV